VQGHLTYFAVIFVGQLLFFAFLRCQVVWPLHMWTAKIGFILWVLVLEGTRKMLIDSSN